MNEYFLETIRSDDLVELRDIFEKSEAFRELIAPIFQLEVIVDANVIISDLIHLARGRKAKPARTKLQELIDSETVVAYAPSILKVEVNKHLSTISKKKGIPIEDLEAEWREYAKKIIFRDTSYRPPNSTDEERDPDDLPYITLQQKTGAPIYTRDKDIHAMDGQTIGYTVITHLRDYSRYASIEYTIKYQGVVVAVLNEKLIEVLFSFIKSLARFARKLPSWVWFVVCGVLIAGLLNSTSRYKIATWMSYFSTETKEIGLKIFNLTEPFILEHQKAQKQAIASLKAVNSELQMKSQMYPR